MARIRLDLVIVTDTYSPELNGVAATLACWVEYLIQQGHRVTLVVPYREDRMDPPDTLLQSVRSIPLPGYRSLRLGLASPSALTERWRSDPPDLVYVATEGPLGWAAVAGARRLGLPVVSGYHTRFASYGRHYAVAAVEPWVRRWLKRFHNRTDLTLAPTEALRDELVAGGYRRVEVIGRGVDVQRFCPELRERPRNCRDDTANGSFPRVLYVGRLAPEKNLGAAIRAFEAIRTAHGRGEFVLVGEGPLRRTLQAKHPEFHFRGALKGEELAREYANADLFLFPSQSETFGNVVLEAMASALPVVAFDHAAAASNIHQGLTGLLAPVDDEEAFVRHAVALAGDAFAAAAMGRLARSRVGALTWWGVCRLFEALLVQTVEASRAKSLAAAENAA